MLNLIQKNPVTLLLCAVGIAISAPLFTSFSGTLPRPIPIGFIFITILAIKFLFLSKKLPPKILSLYFLLVFFSAISCYFAVFKTELPIITFFLFLQIVLPFAGFLVVYNLVQNENHIKILCAAISITLILFSLFIFLENAIFYERWINESMFYLWPSKFFTYYQFYQYMPLVIASGFILILYCIESFRYKLLLFFTSIALTLLMLGFQSYAGLCIMLVASFFILISFFSFRHALYGSLFLLVISSIALAIFLQYQDLPPRVLETILTVNNRTTIWERSLNKIAENPFFGTALAWGFGEHIRGAHNQLLDVIMRYGLFAGFIWFALIVRLIILNFQLILDVKDNCNWYQPVTLGLSAISLGVVTSILTTPFQQLYSGTMIWALFAIFERKLEFIKNKSL